MKATLLIVSILFFGLKSFAQPNGYYERAENLSGFALKTALSEIIDDINDNNNGQPFHQGKGYGDLWELYEDSDSRIENGMVFVFDMYSDCDLEFITDQDRGTGGTTQCDKFNREHSFPRSWFNDRGLDIYSDPFHVIPTDKKVNFERGSLAYGEVIDGTEVFTSNNGSRVGASAISGPTGNVFEPIDEYKGDIARQYFYVATRYEDLIANWETNDTDGDSMLDGSSDKVFEDWSLNMLFEWHINDPVSEKEQQRQDAIFNFQGNRNPFIDNPEWVEMIWANVLSTKSIQELDFQIFPNPISTSENSLNIRLETNSKAKIAIYSILGKKVLEQDTTSILTTLNVSSLNAGIYIIKIEQGTKAITRKLIRK